MVSCKQCNVHNSLDSAFCKKCGATLDAADIAVANDRLASTIADGNRLFADGRTDDALMVAETAVSCNPTSAAAISLKGMCLERKGMLAEALECFETVVELQPDSTLDKLKVNDLKNLLVVEKFEVNRAPDRRMALVGGMAAVMLVVACGALFAKANAGSNESPSKLVAMNEKPEVQTFGDVMTKNTDSQALQNPGTQTTPQTNLNQGQPDPDPQVTVPNPRTRPELDLPRSTRTNIPRISEGADGRDYGFNPINPGPPPSGPIGNPNGPTLPQPDLNNKKGSDDPEPEVEDPGKTSVPSNQDVPKTPGIIEIEVSKGGKTKSNNGGGEASPNSGNGRQALIATARSQMMSGNYSGAANTYERALRAGADQGSTNQRLAQCYQHMGRSGDAVAAYTRAASAFEKSGNSQGADACRQAIKVLGG